MWFLDEVVKTLRSIIGHSISWGMFAVSDVFVQKGLRRNRKSACERNCGGVTSGAQH